MYELKVESSFSAAHHLLNYDGEVSNRCESFLFLADRAQNIDVAKSLNYKS